jgi:TolA-binding protein
VTTQADELRDMAAHYRELPQWVTDAQARTGIEQLAHQYEARAQELEGGSQARAARCGD